VATRHEKLAVNELAMVKGLHEQGELEQGRHEP
jgi:hypothetical protein